MAAEGADAVDALAVLTQVRHHLALVDVCKNTVDMVKKSKYALLRLKEILEFQSSTSN